MKGSFPIRIEGLEYPILHKSIESCLFLLKFLLQISANLEPQEPDKKCHVNVTITIKVALSHIFHCMFPKKNFSGRLYLLIQ